MKCQKQTDMSHCDDQKCKSARNKGRQQARSNKREQAESAVDQSLEQLQTLSCVCCNCKLTSQEEKRNHLITTSSCQLYLKNCFLDKKFVNDAQICDNYDLNNNRCPFCLFIVNDGDVVYHVLIATNCREKLEKAVSRYHETSIEFQTQCEPAPQRELQQEKRCQYSLRNIHKRKYETINRRKDQSTFQCRNHSKDSHKYEKEKQNCPFSEHLYCFNCKKFLKSQADVSSHKCKTTRIVSRNCYNKAVWTTDQYQCKLCSDKFFHDKNRLEMHMLTHENRRSQLFKFVASSSNQTGKVANLGLACLQKNASAKKDKYHCHASNRHNAVASLQEQRNQIEMQHVEGQDLTDEINSDMSCHDDNYNVALETGNQNSSIEVRLIKDNHNVALDTVNDNYNVALETVNENSSTEVRVIEVYHNVALDTFNDSDNSSIEVRVSEDNYDVALDTVNENSIEVRVIEETRPSFISVESNQNTPELAEINKPSIHFDCKNCGWDFCLPDLFTAHVMMYPNCLMFYEKLESEPPALVPFCFKCKRIICTNRSHQCIGVVSIMYKCALCYSMFPNIYTLREHENEKHAKSTLKKVERAETE